MQGILHAFFRFGKIDGYERFFLPVNELNVGHGEEHGVSSD